MSRVNLCLDSRGKYPSVKILVSHHNVSRMVATGVQLDSPDQWASGVVVNHPHAKQLNMLLQVKLSAAVSAQLELEMANPGYEMSEMCSLIRSRIDPKSSNRHYVTKVEREDKERSVLNVWRKFQSDKDGRTWELYHETLRRLTRYLGEDAMQKLQFEDITMEWLDEWDKWLSRTRGINSRAIDLRNLRAVNMYAFKYDYTTAYVFKRWKIKRQETGNIESLTAEEFRTVFRYDLGDRPEAMYRDIALLGFYLIGINIVDMADLKWSDLKNGYISYERAKTHRLYKVKVEPEALAIIERYKGEEHLLSWADRYKDYKSFRQHLNEEGLQRIGPAEKKLVENGRFVNVYHPLMPKLTYYQLRHTWACFAAEIGVPKDIIALCLGHGKKTVTDVYVQYDQRKIDDANRRVIDYALAQLQ